LSGNNNFKILLQNPLKLSDLKLEEVILILNQAKHIIVEELSLLEVSQKTLDNEIFVIGDIHGNLKSLYGLIQMVKEQNPRIVIFLGDLVDRGPYQLECLLTVLILKILEPNKYYLLRGNHETKEMNKYYGFYQVFTEKFGNNYRFNEILELYSLLPYCALINDQILCLHGGIPEKTETISNIKGLKVNEIPSILRNVENSLLEILWNDPKEDLSGFCESYRGPGIKFFGEDAFNIFMNRYHLSYLIRAHEMFEEGYKWFFNKRLLSIFSSENYRGSYFPNPASYAVIKNDHVFPKLI
jgi:diadenosine tetraphosphatase ApaH/serine/threonine PP2A family protein phosphatase